MTIALALMALWAVLAGFLPRVPPSLRPWAVWTLVALGIPLVGLLTLRHGPWVGMMVLAAGVVLLRWRLASAAYRSQDAALHEEAP